MVQDESEVIDVITKGFRDVQQGRLPDFSTSERGREQCIRERCKRPGAWLLRCSHQCRPRHGSRWRAPAIVNTTDHPPTLLSRTPQSSGTSTLLWTPACRCGGMAA